MGDIKELCYDYAKVGFMAGIFFTLDREKFEELIKRNKEGDGETILEEIKDNALRDIRKRQKTKEQNIKTSISN